MLQIRGEAGWTRFHVLYFLHRLCPLDLTALRLLQKYTMDEANKVALERIRKELINAHNRAAWQMAATIVKASQVKGGMDQSPSASELAELNATINNLRTVAEEAIALLKK